MTDRSERVGDRFAVWARSPRGGALLAAVLTLAVLLPLWFLAVNWYRTELLSAGPSQRSLLVFEVGGLIAMVLLGSLVFLLINRQTLLSEAVQQRTQEMARHTRRLEEELAGRQTMEEELRRSEERHRAVARSFPNGAVFLFDGDLRYILADGAGLAEVGLSKEMLEGLTVWEALSPETVAIIEPHYQAALAGASHVFEAGFGGRFYLTRTLPLRDDRGAIIAGMAVAQDITDTKRAEAQREAALAALQASEARSQALLNAIPDMMFRMNRDGVFLDYHADASDMALPPESVIGGSLHQLPAPEGVVECMLRKIGAALDTNQIQTLEYSLHTVGGMKDFEARMVADSPNEVVAIVRDITERKRTEQSLHRWAHIFEHAEWGVAIGSADGRTLEMMNPAYAKMHGYTVEELLGMSIGSVFAPGTAGELSTLIQTANEAGHAVIESKHVRKDGAIFPVQVDLTAVKDANGQLLYRVANVQDITERKRAEAILREREEQYRSIFEASLDGLFINSLDGYIVDVNPAGAHMHGYTVEECRGLRSDLFVPPDRLTGLQEFFDKARAGEPFRARGFDRRKDGSVFPVEVSGTQFIYRGEPHALAVVRDITEAIQAEQALQERELQYRNVFESSLDGLFINSLTGQLVDFNPAAAHMHGFTLEEFRQVQPPQFIHPDSLPLFAAFMEAIMAGREYYCRAVDVRKDGSAFPIEVRGTPFTLRGELHAFAIVRDISAQVEAEEALREREEQYRSIFESVSDGLFIDTLDGEMVDFNPAVAHMHGYTVDEFRLIPTVQIIHPDSLHLFQEFVETVKAGRQYRCRAIDVRKDGSLLPVEVTGIPFVYRGRPHMLAVLHDITAQVQAEQQLEHRVTERTRELSTLLDVSRTVASTLELEPLLGLILDQLKTLVGYDGAALLTLQGDVLVVQDYRGPIPREQALQGRFPVEHSPIDQEILRRREPIILGDVRDDTELASAFRESAGAHLGPFFGYIRSWLAVPLLIKERTIGIMALDRSQPQYYTDQHARLAMAIANQAAIAIENARLFTEAQGKAVLEERQRLARDLHDSVTQSLYSLTLLAEAGRRQIDVDVLQAARYLGDMGEIAQQSLKEMRLLVYQLRPLALEHEGLIGALQARLDSVEKRAGIDARFLLEGNLGSLPPALEEGLFRVAQEALNNSLKHAIARSVVVRLRGEEECVTLEVTDDGRGSALLAADVQGGLGLTSMRERAAQLGGTLTIESTPGRGTRVVVEVPRAIKAKA
jgi:PAS domain S-box-containing protein